MSLDFDYIKKLISQVKIEDVIGNYIKIVKKGQNFQALCPFHEDNHPSLSISPSKKIFKCFVCGVGGNVISFIMHFEKLSFLEALNKLLELTGIRTDKIPALKSKSIDPQIRKIFKINETACLYYKYCLKRSKLALSYIEKRQIDSKTCEKFLIGYAPDNKTGLTDFLLSKEIDSADIILAGLAVSQNGALKDYFYDRLIFPILNKQSKITGFSGRAIRNSKSFSKYLNSPETKAFKKSQILFNINNFPINKREERIYLFEGYMDVIAASKIGFTNSLATMGTFLSSSQITLLRQVTSNIILCLDPDLAGKEAMVKLGQYLENNFFNVEIVCLPENIDIDELARISPDKAKKFLNSPMELFSFWQFYLTSKYNSEKASDYKELLLNFAKIISDVKDGVKQEFYINKICKNYNISKNSFLALMKSFSKKNDSLNTRKKSALIMLKRYERLERSVLRKMLSYKEAIEEYRKRQVYFQKNIHRILVNYIINEYEKNKAVNPESLVVEFDSEELSKFVIDLWDGKDKKEQFNLKKFNQLLDEIQAENRESEIRNLKSKLAHETDIKSKTAILTSIENLINNR